MERSENPVGGEEYRQALATVSLAKNVFWWLICAALAVQLAAFVLVRFGKVVDGSKKMRTALVRAQVTPAPAPAGAPAKPAEPVDDAAETWYAVLEWVLPVGKFVALAAGMLLVLTLMFAVKLALHGRTGGIAGLLSAFFWSLLLWVFLIPWQQALPGSSLLRGALSNAGDLVHATAALSAEKANWLTGGLYYARFAAYPVAVALLWLWVQLKFSRGYRRAMGIEVAEVSQVGPEAKM